MGWLILGIIIGIILGAIGTIVFCAWIMDEGCEFCDNGERFILKDKYDYRVNCFYCPICGRRVE